VLGGSARADDAARLAQCETRLEARDASCLPDDKVPVSRAALFRAQEDARRALDELVGFGKSGIPALVRAAASGHAQMRANAAWGLGQIGGPATVDALVAASGDASPAVRFEVALALGNTASAAGLRALDKLSDDKDETVRATAIQTSAYLRDVLTAEEEPTPDKRIAALVRIAYTGPARARLVSYGGDAVRPLIAALDDTDRGIVSGAVQALARIGDARALDPLYNHFDASLKAGKAEIKFAQGLADFRGREVWPFLQKLLAVDCVPAVAYALDRIGNFDHPERLLTVTNFLQAQVDKGAHTEASRAGETQENLVAKACDILGRVGDKSVLPLLTKIKDEAPPADKSIVKPTAEHAIAQITARG